MLYWIFDLDQTLYQLPSNVDFNYKLLKKNEHLKYLLDELPSTKVIFTNGTYNHAKICLNKIDIENNFKSIISRDKILTLKPEHNSYLRCMNLNNITNNDKCVFFDDLPDNLINAKSFGWITVLINRNKYIDEQIDFWFPNIYVALNYFLSKIN
jgi:HAD superfamily hydrolase (TIGR01509 family)